MSATIHSLAPELLDHILDLVRSPGIAWTSIDSAAPANSDLLSAALVCRSWAETAQRVLWRDARITLDQAKPLPALPISKYPLRSIWISVRGRRPEANQATLNEAMTNRLNVWLDAEAPHVKSLCLTTQRADAGPDWSILQSKSLSGLTRLDFEYCEEVQDPIDILKPISFHLTHLGLAIYSSPPSSHLIGALFSGSRDTLKSLRLSISSEPGNTWREEDLLKEELAMVGPNLERLVIEFTCAHDNGASCLNLAALVGIKELGLLLSFSDQSFQFGEYFPIAPYLDQFAAPSTLSIFAVGINDATCVSDVKEVLSHSALDHLDHLQRLELIGLGKDALESVEAGIGLMEACEQRGIALVFREGLF